MSSSSRSATNIEAGRTDASFTLDEWFLGFRAPVAWLNLEGACLMGRRCTEGRLANWIPCLFATPMMAFREQPTMRPMRPLDSPLATCSVMKFILSARSMSGHCLWLGSGIKMEPRRPYHLERKTTGLDHRYLEACPCCRDGCHHDQGDRSDCHNRLGHLRAMPACPG